MDEVLVSKVIEKISQTGTAFLDIIHLADLHLEDGKPLDLPKSDRKPRPASRTWKS